VAKKNSKKNKSKSKDRFRNSIITNDRIELKKDNEVDSNFNVATPNITKSVTSSKVQSLGNELKLIGVIGFSLFAILAISSFVI
tara:strand:- start:311 stop:562 length:252 start_codon:yes stop_codon:yes gene_type:complete